MKAVDTITMGNQKNVTVFITIFSTLLCALSLLLRFSSELNQKTQEALSPQVLQANVAATILDHDLYLMTIDLLHESPQIHDTNISLPHSNTIPCKNEDLTMYVEDCGVIVIKGTTENVFQNLLQRVAETIQRTLPDDAQCKHSNILYLSHSHITHTTHSQLHLPNTDITTNPSPVSLSTTWHSPPESYLAGFPDWRSILRESPRPTAQSTV